MRKALTVATKLIARGKTRNNRLKRLAEGKKY
jgi:hypothetical protein